MKKTTCIRGACLGWLLATASAVRAEPWVGSLHRSGTLSWQPLVNIAVQSDQGPDGEYAPIRYLVPTYQADQPDEPLADFDAYGVLLPKHAPTPPGTPPTPLIEGTHRQALVDHLYTLPTYPPPP